MKPLMKLWNILAIASAFAGPASLAQEFVTFSLDENGHGIRNAETVSTFTGGLVPVDPSGGVAGPVLLYQLPGLDHMRSGDVLLTEIVDGHTNISDVIRFWSNNVAIFYSDSEPGSGDTDLADVSGLPAQLLTNRVTLLETGVEGNNGASYFPSRGQPGSDDSPLVVVG